MNTLNAIALFLAVAVAAPVLNAQQPHVGRSRVALGSSSSGAQQFRTDINPALRYYQAFLEMPNLSEADQQDLFARDWRGQTLDKRFGDLVSRYDIEFRFLREAARAEVPCDWGIDLTEGPDALLPGLARAKNAAQAARLRVMWHLQNGRQIEARDDLLAAFTLARNVSRDGVLVSAMVQMAAENLLGSVVAENFFHWQPETLQQIADGFDAAPARGTVAQCIPAERHSFHDWLLRKVQELQQANPNNEARTVERLSELFARVGGEAEPDQEFAARVIKAGGGTTEGVLRLIRDLAPMYDKVTALMNLPHGPFEEQMAPFMAEVEKHPNPLVPKLDTLFEKCRTKEFAAMVKQAMVRAGVEFKLRGEAGLKSVTDPCGKGPFAVRRFVFEGEDRGFELRSTYHGRGHDEVLIFVEKNGTPFMIEGKNAGKRIPGSK
ncbi:MAG TPA: hypothetical protein VFA77_01245 [Candidatus Eisenbacteria bacterium]|nr:hypothetical protein [Candidatus Eisenbacteria bacterium]